MARNYLIPDELYYKFLKEYLYKDKKVIKDYAYKIGIAPHILVGRMLHDGLIDYRHYSDLRPSFEIVNVIPLVKNTDLAIHILRHILRLINQLSSWRSPAVKND